MKRLNRIWLQNYRSTVHIAYTLIMAPQTLDEYYPPYHDRLRQTLTEINAHKHVQIIKYDRHAHDEASWSSRIHIPLKKMFN